MATRGLAHNGLAKHCKGVLTSTSQMYQIFLLNPRNYPITSKPLMVFRHCCVLALSRYSTSLLLNLLNPLSLFFCFTTKARFETFIFLLCYFFILQRTGLLTINCRSDSLFFLLYFLQHNNLSFRLSVCETRIFSFFPAGRNDETLLTEEFHKN